MAEILFLAVLAAVPGLMFIWGFRVLPGEGWQVMAAVPLRKDENGWLGLNLLWYGFFIATAVAFSLSAVYVLLRSLMMPVLSIVAVCIVLMALCLPSATVIARIVEGKKYTFTVGGASFLGIVTAPWIIYAVDSTAGLSFNAPCIAVLAALGIGFALGEGMGRLACISFGCCYGRPLDECAPFFKKTFERFHFVFHGRTKKIAYEKNLEGQRVVPVQAITAVILSLSGIMGTLFFLSGSFALSFVFTVCASQTWRVLSEFMRADFRGGRKFSAYQIMAIIAAASSIAAAYIIGNAPAPVDIEAGISSLWSPGFILFIQASWLVIFLYTGRSSVTESTIQVYVNRDRI